MGRRLGLIIGVNQYQDAAFQPLQFAENDARAFAQWLVNVKGGRWLSADVQFVQGAYATHELAESLLAQLCLTVAEAGDLVLIYFAGHAYIDERSGDGYLALANTRYYDTSTGLHLPSFAQHLMARSRASHILCIFDCFQTGRLWSVSRAFPYDSRPLLRSTLAQALPQQGNRLFLCSCRGNDVAPEAGERNIGLFMYSTIVGLSGPAIDPALQQVTLQRLQTFLSSNCSEQQRPVLCGQERSPLALVGDSASLSLPQQVSSPSGSSPRYIQSSIQDSQSSSQSSNSAIAAAQLSSQSAPTRSGHLFSATPQEHRQQQCQLLLDQARQYMHMQNPTEVYSTVERVLQIEPRDLSALTLKGQLLGTMGRFQEALAVVEQLIQLDSNNALAWSMRAVLLTNIGQHQAAFAAIERSLVLDATNPETHSIKDNIMTHIATAQSREHYQLQESQASLQQMHKEPLPFLLGAAIHIIAFVIGVIGSFFLFFASIPGVIGLGLQSLGLAILCVNAARGAYRYGFTRLLFVGVMSMLVIGLLGVLYKFGSASIIGVIKVHPTTLIPMLFLAGWLVLAATLPLLLAVGGFIGGILQRKNHS